MLRRLAQAHSLQTQLSRSLGGLRAASAAADGTAALGDRAGQGQPEAQSGRSSNVSRPRFLVPEERGFNALELIEKSLHRTPVILPAAGGAKTRYLKLPPPQVCSKVLTSAAGDPRQVVRAAELADALSVQGVQLEPQALQALVVGLTKRGKVEAALPPLDRWLQHYAEALEQEEGDSGLLRGFALGLLTGLLDCAAKAEQTELLQQVLARMARVGLLPTAQSITGILQCFMRLGQPRVAYSILQWMRQGGLRPNVFHYTTLLSAPRELDAAAAAALLQQAKQAYDQMLEEGVAPNTHFYTAYIGLCGRARDMGAAMEAWNDMAEFGIAPDRIVFSSLIHACAKCQSGELALELYRAMKDDPEARPDAAIFGSLLIALKGPPANIAAAREVWADMAAGGVRPNYQAAAAYLDILLGEGEVDEAIQLLTAAAEELRGLRPRSGAAVAAGAQLQRLYRHFMFAMANQGQHWVVEQLARHLRSQGLRHSAGTLAAMLTSQAVQQPAQVVGRWLLYPEDGWEGAGGSGGQRDAMQPVSIPEHIEDCCLRGRGNAAELADRLMSPVAGKRGKLAKGSLTTASYNVLLGGLAVQGQAAKAFEFYDWAQLEGVRSDAWTLRLLMFAALNAPADFQFDLLVRALGEGRQHAQRAAQQGGRRGGAGGGNALWDERTRRAVLSAIRQSNKAQELLGTAAGSLQTGEESEQRMRRILAMLGSKGSH